MTQERKMPNKEKEQQLSDGRLKRRQFLKTVVIGSGAVAVGTALPTYSGEQELRNSGPELERIKAVLNNC
ncbi:uncharacterized protein METZ01_LOCUS401642, partial [marine metagenome]